MSKCIEHREFIVPEGGAGGFQGVHGQTGDPGVQLIAADILFAHPQGPLRQKWKSALRLGGALIFEVGIGQASAVEEILEKNGYEEVKLPENDGLSVGSVDVGFFVRAQVIRVISRPPGFLPRLRAGREGATGKSPF